MTTEDHFCGYSLNVDDVEPLTTLITIRDGREVTVSAQRNCESDATARNAVNVFGAWSDLDWDEAAVTLDRIRHEDAPTPPVDE